MIDLIFLIYAIASVVGAVLIWRSNLVPRWNWGSAAMNEPLDQTVRMHQMGDDAATGASIAATNAMGGATPALFACFCCVVVAAIGYLVSALYVPTLLGMTPDTVSPFNVGCARAATVAWVIAGARLAYLVLLLGFAAFAFLLSLVVPVMAAAAVVGVAAFVFSWNPLQVIGKWRPSFQSSYEPKNDPLLKFNACMFESYQNFELSKRRCASRL